MANTCTLKARAGMGKARAVRCQACVHAWHLTQGTAVRCQACAHEGRVQVVAWRAQARNRYAHTKGFVDVGLCLC